MPSIRFELDSANAMLNWAAQLSIGRCRTVGDRKVKSRRGILSCKWLVVPAVLVFGSDVGSAPILPDDMFFPPASLIPDVYPIQPMAGDGETAPFTAVWGTTDILARDPGRVDITITGVQILPVLVPNPSPSSEEGEYTDADLVAITVANYLTYFKQRPGTDITDPNTDYIADLTNNVLTLQFGAQAVYAVGVRTTSRGSPGAPLEPRDYIYTQFVKDFTSEDGARAPLGVHRELELPLFNVAGIPQKDLYIVSAGDPDDNGANETALDLLRKRGKNVRTASTLQEAIDIINAESAAAQRKLTVTLVGHGSSGQIKIGTERIGRLLDMYPDQFGRRVAASVSRLTFFSCNTAEGALGRDFLRLVSEGIEGTATGWEHCPTCAPNIDFLGIRLRDGYFDLAAGGKRHSETALSISTPTVSEWGLVVLMLLVVATGTAVIHRRGNIARYDAAHNT